MRTIAIVMSTTMCAMIWSHVPVQAEPVGTSFNYQGQLKLDGVPLSDYADFRFSVWNAHLGGQQVGVEYQINGITVDSGLFTVRVDVGANVFTGDARWIQVAVRYPMSTGSFVTLTPRQLMTPTPYALFSDQTRGIFASNDGKVGIGTTMPKQSLHVAGDYYGRGHLWLYAYEGDRSSGSAYVQARDDSGSSSIDLRLRAQQSGSSVDVMTLKSSGNVGIGTGSPTQKLDVNGTGQFSAAAGPHLIIRDSNGSNDRPGIQFTNNNAHYIAGDDASNEAFGFYSQFGNARAYDATLSIYGNTQGSLGTWGRCLTLTHDGMDGRISTDTGNILLNPAGRLGVATDSPLAPFHLGNVGPNWGWTAGNGWGDFCLGNGSVGLAMGVAIGGAGAGDVRLWTRGGTERLFMGSPSGGVTMTLDDGRVGMTGIDAEARLNVTSLALSAPSQDWAAHFKDANGTGEAWIAGDDGEGRDKGIIAQGTKVGGQFYDVNGTGEARLAYTDPDNYRYGVWGRGYYGGYFESSEPNGGKAWLGNPYTGVSGHGLWEGGYFVDTDDTAWAEVASGSSKIYGNGSVHFVQNHPFESDRVIVYTAPEGDEVATFTRGSARLSGGRAVVSLGETFAWVTNPDIGLTAHLTPRGDCAGLFAESLNTHEMVVQELGGGTSDVVFDYLVFGLRIGFEETAVIRRKDREATIPSMATHQREYDADPALRSFNALERFKGMRIDVGETAPLDLSAASELRGAVMAHNSDGPESERPNASGDHRNRGDAGFETYETTQRRSMDQNDERHRVAEMEAMRDRLNELEILVSQLMEAQTRQER